jgi:hypothetical protein
MALKLTREQAKHLGMVSNSPKQGRHSTKRAQGGGSTNKVMMLAACQAHGLPEPVFEYRFKEGRKWAFDFLFDGWLAVEKVGGVWIRGHHSRGKDQIDDMAKRNEAQISGYVVLEFTPQQFDSGEAFAVIARSLQSGE